jgi:hypothetical protein
LPQRWIAERLNLKLAGNVSQEVRRVDQIDEKELPIGIRKWKKKCQDFLPDPGGAPRQQALDILKQKQIELETRQ